MYNGNDTEENARSIYDDILENGAPSRNKTDDR